MMSPQTRAIPNERDGEGTELRRATRRLPGALSLGVRLARAPAPDAAPFVVAHQAHELWFSQLLCELAVLIADLDAARTAAAGRTLERATRIAVLLVEQMRALDALPPAELRDLESLLDDGAGRRSDPLRRLERIAGTGPAAFGRWLARERRSDRPRSASVREAFVRAVAREWVVDPEAPAPAGAGAGELAAWLHESLARPALGAQRELAGALLALDEQLAVWRLLRQGLGSRLRAGTRPRAEPRVMRRFFPEL